MKYFFSVLALSLFIQKINAQNYHAVEGSPFAGSLGVGNNPASIVNTPFPWDVDIFSMQLKSATNLFTINNYSLLSSNKNTTVTGDNGNYSRFSDVNFNINLLNTRIALNRKQAISFGANLRGYGTLKTGAYGYNDTVQNIRDFFLDNDVNNIYRGNFTGSSWLEAFATYSQTIWDGAQGRLNAGITVKAMRGIAGAFAQLQNGSAMLNMNSASQYYTLKTATAKYGYSYNFDGWQNGKSTTNNIKDFLVTNTRGGFSFDIGAEYLIKSQAINTSNEDDYFDYEWKIGVSILDIGHNQYRYGNNSRSFTGPISNLADSTIDEKLDSATNFNNVTDSLSTILNGFSSIAGKFKIQGPTRLVVNIDKPLGNDFYINANVSINLGSLFNNSNGLYARELNLLTITPRWETKRWGVYFPIQYNADKQFWIGAAFKAGPLLLGIHNWANIFSRNKMQDGGGYIAFVIRSSKITKKKTDKRLECPPK